MKAAVFSVLLLLTVYQSEGLKCNFCFSKDSTLCSPTSTQTCPIGQNACGAVIITQPVQSSFRQCMNMAVCEGWKRTPGAFAICCSTDLCN
uniref:UPAR/Ly6 domain-containing protein n=1 Tax=Sphaeramia orbicularis TaxID=375764 RepID=A0A673AFY7_9TELE